MLNTRVVKAILITLGSFLMLLCLTLLPSTAQAVILDENPPNKALLSTIYVSGTIAVDTTWTAGNVYVVYDDNLTIASDVTLTIEPGVIVKFRGNECDHNTGLFINGTLLAQGTETDRIYFTSLLDDSAGGDTNGDGGATTPAAGDWTRIEFSGSGADNSTIEHAVIRYAGHWKGGGSCWTHYYYPAINLLSASPTISNTEISDNYLHAVGCSSASSLIANNTLSNNGGDGVWMEGSSIPTITDNTISSNDGYGVYCSGTTSPPVTDNVISNNGKWAISTSPVAFPTLQNNTLVGNNGNGVELRGGDVDVNITWKFTGHPYGVTDDISVGSGVTLTVEPGVIVKFRGNECDHNTGLFVNGTLLARGTETDRIYFTSLLDDSAGGDVNGDGGATTPAAGDWTRIEFSGSGADNSVIEYTVIRYAGHWKGGGSCWTHYYYGAIHALGASPAISRTMFIENQNGVWAELLANPTIHYCKIQGNVDYGVRNDDSNVLIDATYNWWGDSQGPTTETYTTPDSDKASNYVDYDPWLPQSPFAPTVLGTSANEVTNDLDNTVIVTGTKFLPTPAVKLGSMPMGGVTWITATRISFVIPVGFPTGTYALTIVNPDGESTTAPNAMTVRGTESYIYLPVVLRNHQ